MPWSTGSISCSRSTALFEPGPTPSSPEEALAWRVEDVEIELRRVEQRLRTIGWGTPPPRRLSMAEEWGVFAGTLEPVDYSDGDGIVYRVLDTKRSALLEELRRLRQQLAGPGDRPRGRWG